MEQVSGNHVVEISSKYVAGEYVVPRAVIDSLLKAWPNQFTEIMKDLRFAGDHYSFTRWGMYVGVEFDGYIHT